MVKSVKDAVSKVIPTKEEDASFAGMKRDAEVKLEEVYAQAVEQEFGYHMELATQDGNEEWKDALGKVWSNNSLTHLDLFVELEKLRHKYDIAEPEGLYAKGPAPVVEPKKEEKKKDE